jgi:hypothetical protein
MSTDQNDADYPGDEQHLPHESWHVVQEKRKRRRVEPDTSTMLAYISPAHETATNLTKWLVTIKSKETDWVGYLASYGPEKREELDIPAGVTGEFHVTVVASGPNMKEKKLACQINDKACDGTITIGKGCTGMTVIHSVDKSGKDARFYNNSNVACPE